MVTEALTMSLSSKREYLAKIHGRYQRAGRPHKSRILDEFCLNCGYHRKAALRLLHRPLGSQVRKRSGPKVTYDPDELLPVLKAVWLASDQLCSKLLKPALGEWLEHHERRGAPLPGTVKEKLLAISPAQIDRLLQPARVRHPRKGLSATRPGTLLRRQVPTRGGRPTRVNPVQSRPTRWPIAATQRRAIRLIPLPIPSCSVAGRRTAPSGTRVAMPSLAS
jgi:hypothetical protein